MPRIDAVLYDFGGVFTASPFTAVRRSGVDLGIDVDEAIELCFGPYHEDTDHPWHRLERGELSLEEGRTALVELARARGHDVDPVSFLGRMAGEDHQRPVVVERARAIKAAGVRTAVVTNNIAEYGDAWRAMVPVDELFDAIVDSCRTGVRKPDPRAYRLGLDAVGASPERTAFLDDHPANVAAAEALGIHGILVGEDRVAAFDELARLLDLPAPATP